MFDSVLFRGGNGETPLRRVLSGDRGAEVPRLPRRCMLVEFRDPVVRTGSEVGQRSRRVGPRRRRCHPAGDPWDRLPGVGSGVRRGYRSDRRRCPTHTIIPCVAITRGMRVAPRSRSASPGLCAGVEDSFAVHDQQAHLLIQHCRAAGPVRPGKAWTRVWPRCSRVARGLRCRAAAGRRRGCRDCTYRSPSGGLYRTGHGS
jgi:hypothetical protein